MKKISAAELVKSTQLQRRPTREEAMEAVATLIAWTGDDPNREGLRETPRRVVEAFDEYFKGYREDAVAILQSPTFEHVSGYGDMIMLRGVRVESHCEHHIAPFIGTAHVAYVPGRNVAGLSKLARVVDVYAKRLQTQEAMTVQIAQAIMEGLNPRGAAVMIEAEHHCMSTRGVHHVGVDTITTSFTGIFESDVSLRDRFIGLGRGSR